MRSPSGTLTSVPHHAMRAVLTVLCILIAPSIVFAHAVVFPKTSTPGTYEKYVLRVPNERDVPTLQVELRFPKVFEWCPSAMCRAGSSKC
jgi:uncharacterized protein YcnI